MASGVMVETLDLKAGELLKEVQLDYSPAFTKCVEDTVSVIKEAIDKIPGDFKATADLAPGFVRDVGADKVEFKFKKPKSYKIGGSYSFQCIAKPDVSVDLLMRLPKDCFYEKDYLNHRYHAKRCLYLCIIKKHLERSKLGKVEWSTLQNEARKPILKFFPVSVPAGIPLFSVRIIPTATTLFNAAKLNMTHSNIRVPRQGEVSQATPKYNCSILEDMLIEDFDEVIQKTFLGWKELGEALILLKIWARQRGSLYGHDCLSGFLVSIIVSYLTLKSGGCRVTKSMNAIQIFRIVVDFIANSEKWETGLFFWPQGDSKISKEELKERKKRFQSSPVLISDPSGHFNSAFRMTKISFSELRDEAALTLACLAKCGSDGFEKIFLTKADIPAKYDYCIRLNLKGNDGVHASGYCTDEECWRLYEEKINSLLCQALTDRVTSIRVIWRNCSTGYRAEDGFSSLDKEPLLVGITLDSVEKAFRVVDIGPYADNKKEAMKFRNFWGEKSELRRFKDGTIAESTVWECKQWERHLIVKRIVEYILTRHVSLAEENITVAADQLDFSLCRGEEDPISGSGSLLEAYEVLGKRLRLLEDIPLKVSSVQHLDAAFRSTSVFPPKPHLLAKEKAVHLKLLKLAPTCIQPLEVMIQLEGSGNWPMDELATEKTKSAFLLKIAESLENRWGMTCVASEENVDILLSGYAFRLKILHERGLSLMSSHSGGKPLKRVSSIDKMLFLRGQHASMINGLLGRYPIYGPVVRLAKRWAASHLFSACLKGEVVELLVASLFISP